MNSYTANLPDLSKGYCVVDTETSGLSPSEDAIIELSILIFADEAVTVRTSLLKSIAVVPKNITDLTGITTAMMTRDGRPPAEILSIFLEMPELSNLPIVGHNFIAFDRLFLLHNIRRILGDDAFSRASGIFALKRLVDTGALYKGIQLGSPPSTGEDHPQWVERIMRTRQKGLQWNLRAAAKGMGVKELEGAAHRARYDVILCHLLLQKILEF